MENLRFRRQFLFSARECHQLEDWHQEVLGKHILYVHKDCEISRVDTAENCFIIVGFLIDPKAPTKSTLDILTGILNLPPGDKSELPSVNDISEFLYSLTGRFVLLIKNKDDLMFFNDPCGLKTLYYTKYENEIYAASQPLLIEFVVPIRKSINHQQYHNSAYCKNTVEHYIPPGTTFYDNVFHLTPNHYFESESFKQVRYWPVKSLRRRELEEGIEAYTSLLRQTMIAVNKRYRLSLPLTAGIDSRAILSACKGFTNDLFFFTLQYRDLNEKSYDIKIPSRLSSHLGFDHEVIDCRMPINKDFEKIYINNTDFHHLNDWGSMCNGMYNNYPSGLLAVKGNCSEIGRRVYYKYNKHPDITNCDEIFKLLKDESGWKDIPFIRDRICEWFDEINDNKVKFNYLLLDLFYWEHRMGGWVAQSYLEMDIIHDSFTPFNNRELVDIVLSVDLKYRSKPGSVFFKKSMKVLWKEVLKEPFGPRIYQNIYGKTRKKIGAFLGNTTFYKILRNLYRGDQMNNNGFKRRVRI
jgi:hypothetical protein